MSTVEPPGEAPSRVTVRYWAGAKSAAGVAEETVEAATLAEAVETILASHDAPFAKVISVCSFVVSQKPVGSVPHERVTLNSGDIVEVLPPFAGGAR